MSREEALELAPADPLGRRWARARSRGREYLAWRDGDREVIQLTRRGWKAQVRTVPEGLAWVPVPAWQELAPAETRVQDP